MNTLTGEVYGYPNKQEGDKISLSYSIPPAGSLLLFIPGVKQAEYPIPSKVQNFRPVQSSSPAMVTRNEENAC